MKVLTRLWKGIRNTGIVFGYLFRKPKLVRRMISHLYKGYFLEMGWIKSFMLKRPVDRYGNPLPWLTYSAIEFLNERLSDEMSVFEFGGGNSTFYLSTKVHDVTTVEHNQTWFEFLQNNVAENCTVTYCELEYGGDYSHAASNTDKVYDIVIVDGRDRVNCATDAIKVVGDSGVVIFDDFERERYQKAVEYFVENGFRQFNFWGFKPGLFDRSNTAIFYRDNNVLGL